MPVISVISGGVNSILGASVDLQIKSENLSLKIWHRTKDTTTAISIICAHKYTPQKKRRGKEEGNTRGREGGKEQQRQKQGQRTEKEPSRILRVTEKRCILGKEKFQRNKRSG